MGWRRRSAGWLLALLVITGCAGGSSAQHNQGLSIGFTGIVPVAHRTPAPQLEGGLLGGGRLALSGWRGQVVLVNFWASWCAPCQRETTTLEQAYLATAPLGVRFVGVDVNDSVKEARTFRAAHHVTYPTLVDPTATLLDRFPQLPQGLPSSVLIDRSGRVAGTWIGAVSGARLIAALRTLAAAPAAVSAAS